MAAKTEMISAAMIMKTRRWPIVIERMLALLQVRLQIAKLAFEISLLFADRVDLLPGSLGIPIRVEAQAGREHGNNGNDYR